MVKNGDPIKKTGGVATYARVSSHDQKKKGDLARQQQKLRQYCEDNSLDVISDVASGLIASQDSDRETLISMKSVSDHFSIIWRKSPLILSVVYSQIIFAKLNYFILS